MTINVQKGSTAPAPADFFAGTYSVPRVNLMPPEIEAERGLQEGAGRPRRRHARGRRPRRRRIRPRVSARPRPSRTGSPPSSSAPPSCTPSRPSTPRCPWCWARSRQPSGAGDRDGHRRALVRVPRPAVGVVPQGRLAQGHDRRSWRPPSRTPPPPRPTGDGRRPSAPSPSTASASCTTTSPPGSTPSTPIEGFHNATYTTAKRTDLDGNVVVDFTSTVEVGPEALSLRFEPKAS